MLDTHVLVFETLRFRLRLVEEPGQALGQEDLLRVVAGATHLRQLLECTLQGPAKVLLVGACFVQYATREPAFVLEKSREKMLDVHSLVTSPAGESLGGTKCFLRFLGQALQIHTRKFSFSAGLLSSRT